MKRWCCILIAVALCLALYGCSTQQLIAVTTVEDSLSSTTGTSHDAQTTEWVQAEAVTLPEGAWAYRILNFSYGQIDCSLTLYTTAEQASQGEPAWDDANLFLGVARVGEQTFTLFPAEQVQIGMPTLAAWTQQDGTLCVMLTDARTAQYRQTLFTYNADRKAFAKEEIGSWQNVNYFGVI